MPELKDQNEIDAYYLADPTRPRAAGVMWAALVDLRIDALFEIGLRPDKAVYNELFQPSGPLGSYAVKVRLAYMLGWFGEDIYNDLLLVARIRNRFAHSIEAKDFSDQRISAWLKNMKWYQTLPPLLEKYKAAAARPDASADDKTKAYVLGNIVSDPQSSFRQCISFILSHLDECAANMRANLERLAPNWLVAKPGDASEGSTSP